MSKIHIYIYFFVEIFFWYFNRNDFRFVFDDPQKGLKPISMG